MPQQEELSDSQADPVHRVPPPPAFNKISLPLRLRLFLVPGRSMPAEQTF